MISSLINSIFGDLGDHNHNNACTCVIICGTDPYLLSETTHVTGNLSREVVYVHIKEAQPHIHFRKLYFLVRKKATDRRARTGNVTGRCATHNTNLGGKKNKGPLWLVAVHRVCPLVANDRLLDSKWRSRILCRWLHARKKKPFFLRTAFAHPRSNRTINA